MKGKSIKGHCLWEHNLGFSMSEQQVAGDYCEQESLMLSVVALFPGLVLQAPGRGSAAWQSSSPSYALLLIKQLIYIN